MLRKLTILAIATCSALMANAQKKYEMGKPDDPRYAYLANFKPLKEYIDHEKYPNFRLGLAMEAPGYIGDPMARGAVNDNFTETVSGNAMKMQMCVDGAGKMYFSTVKKIVMLAKVAGVNMFGHTLTWHEQQTPEWLNNVIKGLNTKEEKRAALDGALEKWMYGIMEATGGDVKAWDLANETVADGYDGDGDGFYDMRPLPDHDDGKFYYAAQMGDLEYVRDAVRIARESYAKVMANKGGDDGQLKLFINDYNLESDWDNNLKLKSLINWIERWEADGVTKIDGIGTQMHINCYMWDALNEGKKAAIENSFRLMAATGKLVRVSELDMGVMDGNGNFVSVEDMTESMHQRMADLYEWIIKKYLEIIPVEQQWGVCLWCATDMPKTSGWRADTPTGLWDMNWYRKHAYAGVARGLGSPRMPTGIEAPDAESGAAADGADIYDITGRRVGRSLEALPAGLYIVDGKKTLKRK